MTISPEWPDPLDSVRNALAGRFDVGEEIGRGGMAIVYRATDVRHDRPVALKILRPELAEAVGSERFLREITIEAQLNHPHILTLLDSGASGTQLYYLTPWADGGTLRDRLAKHSQLPFEEALRITREIGGALAHAHRSGIVHRDVKPENILFSSGHAQLADFGIAHVVAETSKRNITDSGVAVGTPAYMSPEQAQPGRQVDHRSDQYALACVLFEMLAGEPPFTGVTSQAIVARHMAERPPSLTIVRPDLSPATAAVINRALEKSPAARFSSIEEFLTALDDSATLPQIPVSPSRNRVLVASAGVLAVAAVAVFTLWPQRTPPLSANKVAVFPLSVSGLPAADSNVGVGVAFLLGAALDRAEPLQFIDVAGKLTQAEVANPQSVSDKAARRIAGSLGAASVIRGVVQGHPDSMTVILRLYSVAGDSLMRQSSAAGVARLTPVHHLGLDALVALLPSLIDPNRTIDLAPLRERRAQSVALWMQGERAYRLSQFDSASRFYERALADDSSFALAAVKGAQALNWVHGGSRELQLVELALKLSEQLPPKYAALARGLQGYFTGRADSAIAQFRVAMSLDPEWAEPSAALAEIYKHLLPRQRPLDSLARRALQDAVRKDSGFTTPLYHLIEDAILEGSLGEADRLLPRLRAAGAERSLIKQLQIMRDCVRRPSRQLWPIDGPESQLGVFEAGKSLSAGLKQPDCAEGAFRTVLNSTYSSAAEQWGAFLGLLGLLVARGDDREATTLLDSVSARKGAARTAYVINSIAGAGPSMLANAAALDSFARAQYGEHYERVIDPERLWAMISWQTYKKDAGRATMIADTLVARAARTSDQRSATFAEAARAQAALADGDTVKAIELLERLASSGGPAALSWSFGEALPVERILLARLLFSKKRYQESLIAASDFDHGQPIMFLPFVSESLRIRFEASLALGNARAAAIYRQRLERLGRADLVTSAKRGQ